MDVTIVLDRNVAAGRDSGWRDEHIVLAILDEESASDTWSSALASFFRLGVRGRFFRGFRFFLGFLSRLSRLLSASSGLLHGCCDGARYPGTCSETVKLG